MGAKRLNFGEVLQAIEDKLVDDGVAIERNQVTWTVNDTLPHLTMQSDILLRVRSGALIDMDGGPWDYRWSRLVDVFYRTQSIPDPAGNNKSWVNETFVAIDKILDSVAKSAFTPKDNLGKDLTTAPIKAIGDIAPTRTGSMTSWGEWVCTLEVHYLPLIHPEQP